MVKPARVLAVLIALLPGCGSDPTGPAALSEIEIQAPAALSSFLVNDTAQLSIDGR
jgi:hypothetical protein